MKKFKSVLTKILVVAIILAVIGIPLYTTKYNDHKYMVTVTDKERVTKKSGNSIKSYYLIYATDSNCNAKVFKDTDELFRFKFNSSDFYAKIREGESYRFTVIGYRIPFLSWYENIIKVETE